MCARYLHFLYDYVDDLHTYCHYFVMEYERIHDCVHGRYKKLGFRYYQHLHQYDNDVGLILCDCYYFDNMCPTDR